MKAVIYCRVATVSPNDKGITIAMQERLCRNYALKNGYLVDKSSVFRDTAKSGNNRDNRPALKKMLAKCEKDKSIKAVITRGVDRLARNFKIGLIIQEKLKRAGIKILCTDGIPSKLAFSIRSCVQNYYREINKIMSSIKN